jgi:hypothetical protein
MHSGWAGQKNGKSKKMTTLKAILWRAREKALKGDDRAIKTVLEHAARMPGGPVADDVGEGSVTDQAILAKFREEARNEPNETDKSFSTDDSEEPK